jgi:hypothetical protein
VTGYKCSCSECGKPATVWWPRAERALCRGFALELAQAKLEALKEDELLDIVGFEALD